MIEVRTPSPDDFPAILRLRREVLGTVAGVPLTDALTTIDLQPETIHVAAFDGDEPVATLRIEQNHEYGPYIRRMATRPAYQRRGIGRQVLRMAENHAREKGIVRLTLHAREAAVPFYVTCGYGETGQCNYDPLGRYPQMSKDLTHE